MKFQNTLQRFLARETFDSPSHRPGGFFDTTSYLGNIRGVIFGLLCILIGRYLDLWGQVLWPLFGETLTISNGKMQWHARIGLYMGMVCIVSAILLIYSVYRKRTGINSENTVTLGAHNALVPTESEINPKNFEQRLRKIILRFPILHDIIWGWSFLLGLSLFFVGRTMDGSPVPVLDGLFQLPDLSFFTIRHTPVSALNGIFIGAIAYGINHAISKSPRFYLWIKFLVNFAVGALSVWAWYALTVAMGAPI